MRKKLFFIAIEEALIAHLNLQCCEEKIIFCGDEKGNNITKICCSLIIKKENIITAWVTVKINFWVPFLAFEVENIKRSKLVAKKQS